MLKRRFASWLFVFSGLVVASNACSEQRTFAETSGGSAGVSASAGMSGGSSAASTGGATGGHDTSGRGGTGAAVEDGGAGGAVMTSGGEAGTGGAGDSEPGGTGGEPAVQSEDDCDPDPCLNGATCADTAGGFSCDCAAGYEGERCETNTDDCAADPCRNGATCTDEIASYTCECKDGFEGDDCEINTDDCIDSACQNGTCVDGVASSTCECDSRHSGPACEFLEFKLAGSLFGSDSTRVTGISGDGSVVLLQSSGDDGENVGRMVDFGNIALVDLAQLKAVARFGEAISQDGAVIVGQALQGDTYLPFQLQLTTARTLSMGSLPAGSGSALDVSADGTTIVGYWAETDSALIQAFRYTAAGVEYAGALSGEESNQQATAVSGDGSVVAGTTFGSDALPSRSWRWTASTKKTQNVELAGTAWVNPIVSDMSKDGNVLVGSVSINGVVHAVRWVGDSAKAEDLGPGNLLATNADGSVSVGEDNSGTAAIWTATLKAKTIASLIGDNPDLAGAELFQASAVSEDGKIVAGNAMVAGARQGWVAHL